MRSSRRARQPGRAVGAVLSGLVAAAVGLAVSASSWPSRQPGSQRAASDQRPTFRTGANFVQVDVYPTADGRPVADLTKDDFEVLEDGVPQSVATFEHVAAHPAGPTPERRDPTSTRQEAALVADPHNRVFVLFLDTYHVTDPTASRGAAMRIPGRPGEGRPTGKKPLGLQPIDKAIVNFLERAIGQDDLVAAMSPEMDADRMVFARRPDRFVEWVGTAWARRASWDDMDAEEEQWALCYPPDIGGDPFGCYRGIWEEMVLRRREKLALRAIGDTITRLGALREGRKAVLLISEGWQLFRPDQNLARPLPPISMQGCPPQPPAPPGIRVGRGGKLQTGGTDPQNPDQVDRSACDAARLELALADNEGTYRALLDRANRQNVTFYPIDPRGLAVFDMRSTGGTRPGAVNDDLNRVRGRRESLANLASATDGFMSATNDLDGAMKRIADDMSEYYLLGYNSTNTALDGKFRKIAVRVKRPGVEVRARRGYLAPTDAEVRASAAAAAPADPAIRAREAALASLDTAYADLPLRVSGGFDWTDGTATLWAVAELGEAAARLTAWQEGGDARLTVNAADGTLVASGSAALSAAARGILWRPAVRLQPGDYVVRVSARPSAEGSVSSGGQIRITLPIPSSASGGQPGTPRVLRRGPSTGQAFVPTTSERFRRVERVRMEVSFAGEAAPVSARLLDRRGQPLAVPATTGVRDENGTRVVSAEATLASLAPGGYLLEIAVGEAASRQAFVTAIRIVP